MVTEHVMTRNKSASYYIGSVFGIGGHISKNMGIQTMSLCPPVYVHINIILLFTQCNIHVCIARSQ